MLEKNMPEQEITQCRHSKEKPLFLLGMFISGLLLLMVMLLSLFKSDVINIVRDEFINDYKTKNVNTDELSDEEILKYLPQEDKETLKVLELLYWPVVILIPASFFLFVLYTIGKMYGGVIGNSVRLNKYQYPEVYKMFEEMSQELGLKETPELYLVNGDGVLNAYATCVPGYRNFAAIYSDILERCLKNNDMESLKFILGHELGHIKLNHVKWWYLFLTIWMDLPGVNYLFGLPLSRAQEYGCDKIGEKLSGDSSGSGLMMLGAGKYAYKDINTEEYLKEHFDKPKFWTWVTNLHQSHGLISWRIAAIRKKHQAGLIFRNKE